MGENSSDTLYVQQQAAKRLASKLVNKLYLKSKSESLDFHQVQTNMTLPAEAPLESVRKFTAHVTIRL